MGFFFQFISDKHTFAIVTFFNTLSTEKNATLVQLYYNLSFKIVVDHTQARELEKVSS